jgi:alpha-tubulin suppressor-like RCC1 family protein
MSQHDTRIIQVAMGARHALALRANGTVVAWGSNENSVCDVPSDLFHVVQVVTSSGHALALTHDGHVVAWGNNNQGQCDVPAGMHDVVQIVVCADFSAALDRDGKVWMWGDKFVFRDDLIDIVQIAAHDYYLLALTRDGRVIAWGEESYGRCDVPDGLTDVVQIAMGDHSMALTRDGRVVAWGNNDAGQCNVPAGLGDVVQVAAGHSHSIALTAQGQVVAWGNNDRGQCNVPAELPDVMQVAAGLECSLTLTRDGLVQGWGFRRHTSPIQLPHLAKLYAQGNDVVGLGHGGEVVVIESSFDRARSGPIISDVAQVAISESHLLVLKKDGTVVAWGQRNDKGQCNVPVWLVDVVQVAVGANYSVAVTQQGQVVVWGDSDSTPAELSDVTQISASSQDNIFRFRHLLALKKDGRVVAWGNNEYGQCNVPVRLGDVVQVSAGDQFSLALVRDGRVVAWGSNDTGECQVPAHIASGMVDVVQITAGRAHSLALTRDGRVVAWGNNEYGQCNVPVNLADIVHVIAQDDYSIALMRDGRVQSWGSKNLNVYGRLQELDVIHIGFCGEDLYVLNRDGCVERLTYYTCRPDTLSDVTDVAIGKFHSLALTSQGKVVAWGVNDKGQCNMPLELTSNTNFSYYFSLPKGFQIVQIAVGTNHSLVLTRDGRVVAWGVNDYGQCNVPARLDNVVQVSAGHEFSLALTRDGRVVAWGSNYLGKCQVPEGLSNVVQVVAGSFHSLALTHDGQVVAWGESTISELCNVPTGLCDVTKIINGKYYSVAVTTQGHVVAWGENYHGRCDVPAGLCDVVQVAVEDEYSVALTAQGHVVAWGTNVAGQCDVPVWLRDVVQVAAGVNTAHALLRSGQLVSWGGNSITDTDRLIQIGTSPRLQYIHPFAAYEGGEAELFSTPSGLLKKYHAPEKTPALAKLQHLIAHPVTLTHAERLLIIWPQELAYHPFMGELVGYVMPFVAATQLIDVLDRTKRLTRWPDLATDPRREWQFVLTVARWSAAVLAHIHAHGYVVGDLSPRNILVYEEGTVAFVDCDSYQVGDGSVYGCNVSTAGYRAPEVRQRAHGRLQYSIHSDAFALAVAIFRLLCGNLHPYQGITLPSAMLAPAQYHATKQQYPHLQSIPDGVDATTYCYERGIWPYDVAQQLCVPPVEMQEYYSQVPAVVRGLFGRAFTGAPAQRPTPVEWVQVLDAWLGEVR